MWNGIYLNDDASINLMGNTEIEDAYKAVYATEKASRVRIVNTTFNRNQIGCYFEAKNTFYLYLIFLAISLIALPN